MPEELHFPSEGRRLSGHLARPAVSGGNAPGVLVIHEIFGLTDSIRAVADRLARAGYVALAVDLLAGQSRAVYMARMLAGGFLHPLDYQGVRDTRAGRWKCWEGCPAWTRGGWGPSAVAWVERRPWQWSNRVTAFFDEHGVGAG